jgi:thiol:disulfide interchange protein/DsbC/DsbD-like thiol-disulfide interchange protein
MRIAINGFVALCLAVTALAATKPHTTVDLILPVETARPGDTVLAGVRLRMEPKWHTYWKNPGDAGGATEIKWLLPAGVTAGEIQWPAPERLDTEGITTFVFHDEITLLVPLKLDQQLAAGPLTLSARVSWLECEELCLPGETTVSATLNIANESVAFAGTRLIDEAKAILPRPGSELGLKAAWEGPATNGTRNLIFEWPAVAGVTGPDFFPELSDDYEVQLTPERLPVDSSRIAMRVEVKSETGKWPEKIGGIVVQTTGDKRESFRVGIIPAAPAAVPIEAARPGGSETGAPDKDGVLKYLALALLGGLILNLMPCVLPILSLKVLHIVNQRGAAAAHARKHAFVYLLGVLVTFWALAGLVMAGRLASWGEQFQDPRFVVVMTVLMTLIGLNLFGLFEVILPSPAASKATELTAKEGIPGSFFTGALSVVLGASCVAPMLAAAVGWAISQTPLMIFLAFSMIGLGLALPFVLLSSFPSLQKLLPKPGIWMEKFRIAMGFPMLATVAWLLSQTADHFGGRGPLWVGLFLVVLALAAWIYGEFYQRGSKGRGLAVLIALMILGAGYAWALEHELNWRNPPAFVPGMSAIVESNMKNSIAWQPWGAVAVAKARAESRPVLVDFTANWCLTCQLNQKTSLEIDSVRVKLKEINAVALLGDYTRKNPEITAELKRFERAGVPLVLVYPKDASKPPQLLPTILTPEIVLNALDAAAK